VESLKSLSDLVPVGILIVEDGDDSEVQVNRYGAQLLGEAEVSGGLRKPASDVRLLENGSEIPADRQPLQHAARTGQPVPTFEGQLVRADGSKAEVLISAAPLFDETGKTRGAIAAIVDISQVKESAAAQKLLVHELQHRGKNIVATVGALAERLLKSSTSLDDFSNAFLSRIVAMGRIHDLLSQSEWRGADLHRLIRAALAPYADARSGNILLDGAELVLRPGTAASLGMVLHELAANAAKYGALSTAAGHVDLAWRIDIPDAGPQLTFSWTERDGPAVEPPPNEGFGASFIKRCMQYELEGKAKLRFEPRGLRCTIAFPLHG
jgi:two-component system, chemotaxis family, CheB/CheR fusion protein